VLLRGEDLIALGYRPGPLFRKILRSVEDLQLEGKLRTKKDAIEYLIRTFPLRLIED
jgi:poly(A) polymerase